MPLFFLSGALFPLDGLPKAIAIAARINPLSYGVDALHAAFSGTAHFGIGIDFVVLCAVSAIFLVIGSKLFEKIQV
jgi:ABC-2 type transport system permease protein